MVNVGGPSKGCVTCIQRKIRVSFCMPGSLEDTSIDELIAFDSVIASGQFVANAREANEHVAATVMQRILCFEISRRLYLIKHAQHHRVKPVYQSSRTLETPAMHGT